MHLDADEAPIYSDSYIEALLNGHAGEPIRLLPAASAPTAGIRHVIRVIESGLPRFHPSFLFEERLAAEPRSAAGQTAAIHPAAVDRRLLMGGALASGVSIAGAAMLAWRRRRI